MQFVDSLSNKLTNKIENSVSGMNEDRKEVIHYGIYLIIADISKSIITFTIAYFLGILHYAIIALISMGVLRIFVGGVHAKTWLGCLITNTSILYSMVYASLLLGDGLLWQYKLAIALVCVVCIYIYAPSDHENKPIVSSKQRKMLRIIGFSVLAVQVVVGLLIPYAIVSNIIFMSMIVNFISMLPITYKIARNRHGDAYFESDVNAVKA